jgi:serum/glucocorticoid-regulated kinase 2
LPPYYSRDTEEIYSNILSQDLTFPPGVGGLEVRDLIRKLLEKDRESRLGKVYGIYEILNHPWMKKMST